MSTRVEVPRRPLCDLCRERPAYADARVPEFGSWGYLCRPCFEHHECQLGTGRGQELVVPQRG